MLEELRKAVCDANLELQRQRLVFCSWGNVSGIDRRTGVVIIKPSGVAYSQLTPDRMAAVDLAGKIVEGDVRPSSDTPSHLELYRNFETIGGICHTHSAAATAWAQACKPIPCLGTTHADYFYGPVPVTKSLSKEEVEKDYELNTGRVIVRRFTHAGGFAGGIDPLQMPAVLVANHGPFTWGTSPAAAVESAMVLEQVAAMALATIRINPNQARIPQMLLDKHYLRKHGPDAYYGQRKEGGQK